MSSDAAIKVNVGTSEIAIDGNTVVKLSQNCPFEVRALLNIDRVTTSSPVVELALHWSERFEEHRVSSTREMSDVTLDVIYLKESDFATKMVDLRLLDDVSGMRTTHARNVKRKADQLSDDEEEGEEEENPDDVSEILVPTRPWMKKSRFRDDDRHDALLPPPPPSSEYQKGLGERQ